MISNVLFSSAYSSSVLVYIFGLLHGRHSYLWAETSRTGIPDLSCPEISGHAIEIANVPRPKLFVHKINEKLE